jgi:ankyrin repeat protein
MDLKEDLCKFFSESFKWRVQLGGIWNFPPWNYDDWPSHPSALWISAAANLVNTATFLLKNLPLLQHLDYQEITVASYYGHTEIVHLLLVQKIDLNTAGGKHGSALQAAAYSKHTDIARLLIENGAELNARGGQYGSALQAAVHSRCTEIVRLLLENGVKVDATGGFHGSALQAAAYYGYTEIVRLLLNNGAEVNVAGGGYGSALQAAAHNGYTGIVRILLENGADINAAWGMCGSALQAAAYMNRTDIVRILLEKGAQVNPRGEPRGRALQAAVLGHTNFVPIIEANGACHPAIVVGGIDDMSVTPPRAASPTPLPDPLPSSSRAPEFHPPSDSRSIRGSEDIISALPKLRGMFNQKRTTSPS